ncbi:MAG: hypothetical protein LBE36_13385 [Flavobacteriaceae bacterium]|jgi:hypothetical protein|nr:hypothetical protein [Flavobacteriaceae bacterium]
MKQFEVFFEHDVTALRKCYIEAENLEQAKKIADKEDFNPYDYDNEDVDEIEGKDIRIKQVVEID